jgi:pyrroloquinoline quinone biosynthesis protein D
VQLHPGGMAKLNGSAGAILSRCDGVHTVAENVAALERACDAMGLTEEVSAFLALALALVRHWLEVREPAWGHR